MFQGIKRSYNKGQTMKRFKDAERHPQGNEEGKISPRHDGRGNQKADMITIQLHSIIFWRKSHSTGITLGAQAGRTYGSRDLL